MPGLVPGIHVLCLALNEDVDGRDKPGHDDVGVEREPDKNSLVVFVDRIFTTSAQAPFTNAFDAIAATTGIACLCRVGYAD
jgi:hypothetical protein